MMLYCLHRTYSKFIVGSHPGTFQWCDPAAFLTFHLEVNEENLSENLKHDQSLQLRFRFGIATK